MTTDKRSPDAQFREPFYNREIGRLVVQDLIDGGIDAELLVPEDDDISLAERVRRVNAASWVILVRKRLNATGNGSKHFFMAFNILMNGFIFMITD